MAIELRQLALDDGPQIYQMLQAIPGEENGFLNAANGLTYDEYRQWLAKQDDLSKGIGLVESWHVPQTTYWLMVGDVPVGYGKLRHRLNDRLRNEGGMVAYAIDPAYRNQGYGKLLLRMLIDEAKQMGIRSMLITIANHNIPSIKVALANGGVVDRVNRIRHYMWVDCASAVDDYLEYIRGKVGHDLVMFNGVICAILDEAGRVLLQRQMYSADWGFPGGYMNLGESAAESAVRNIREEIGMVVEIDALQGVYTKYYEAFDNGDRMQPILHMFIGHAVGGRVIEPTDESGAVAWFELSKAPALFNRQHQDALEDLQNGLRGCYR